MKPSLRDDQAIRELSRSPYLLAIADSLLKNLDREALAEVMAAYLSTSSGGKADLAGVMGYALSSRPRVWAAVGAGVAPAVLMGVLRDKGMRSVVFSSVASWIRRTLAHQEDKPRRKEP